MLSILIKIVINQMDYGIGEEMRNYVGEVLSFVIQNRMVPFKVIKQSLGYLTIQSLDLEYEMEILSDTWNKQSRIIKSCNKLDEFDESALEESRACRD